MASLHDGHRHEARPDADRPGVTVTEPRFPTTLVHARESIAQVREAYGDDLVPWPFRDIEELATVRVVTPVKARGRVVHRGGDVTYARWPDDFEPTHVQTWSARSGSPVLVPARQVVRLG